MKPSNAIELIIRTARSRTFSTLESHSKPAREERKFPMYGLDDLVSVKTLPAIVLSQWPLRRGFLARSMGLILLGISLIFGIEAVQAVPDFSGTIVTQKMPNTYGNRPVLAILWNPNRPGEVVPSVSSVDRLLFGARPSVKDWYKENSGSNVNIVRAGVLGWYPSDKAWDHYWNESQTEDTDGDGWLGGHVEKWAEAIRKADADFDYARYDTNRDGYLSSNELAVVIVIPQDSPFGVNRGVVGQEAPTVEPLIVDGKQIDTIVEWYTGNPLSFAIPCHELAHFLLGATDLYELAAWKYNPNSYSMMDGSWGSWHLDPFEKLKAGWLRPTVAIGTTEYNLKNIEQNQETIILYDPRRGPGEYFMLENRWRGTSYDAGLGGNYGIFDQGLAVWHILEDPALYPLVIPPPPIRPGEWGGNGLLMIRRNGGIPDDDYNALFDTVGTVISSTSSPANLKWIDGTNSGFRVQLLTGSASAMTLKITSPVGARIHRANTSNIVSNWTHMNDPYTRYSPNNLIFVTPNWNPPGSSGVYNSHPIGVWYTGENTPSQKWAVFNQDLANVPVGAAFNYRVEVASRNGPTIHKATATNTFGNYTIINHLLANGKPNAILQVTQNWNPPGSGGVYNPHNIGVWYTGTKWSVFNQDGAPLPLGSAFNIRVGLGFIHTATPSNIIGYRTVIDSPQFNGKPGISILVTPNWNPGGAGGTYNDHPIAVWYNSVTSKWEIFNQDFAAMPVNTAFNVTLN